MFFFQDLKRRCTWASAQDQVGSIKSSLRALVPGIQVFHDVDDLTDLGQLETLIGRSGCILVFLSEGYFGSRNCLRELRGAVEQAKPLILVQETERRFGGLELESLKQQCPEDLRGAVFRPDR